VFPGCSYVSGLTSPLLHHALAAARRYVANSVGGNSFTVYELSNKR